MALKIEKTPIEGVHVISLEEFSDARGRFVKIFNSDVFAKHAIHFPCKETFFSVSLKNVLRGFHYQAPPMAMEKIVWVAQGEVLDVVLDIRKHSPTFGQCFSKNLSDSNRTALYLPKGVAHAFLVLSESSTMVYQVGEVFSPSHDQGIRWDSANFKWPIAQPILSEKDKNWPGFQGFVSPFEGKA